MGFSKSNNTTNTNSTVLFSPQSLMYQKNEQNRASKSKYFLLKFDNHIELIPKEHISF